MMHLKMKISSEITVLNQFIPSDSLKTQKYVEDINDWTEKDKMLLNPKKTKT